MGYIGPNFNQGNWQRQQAMPKSTPASAESLAGGGTGNAPGMGQAANMPLTQVNLAPLFALDSALTAQQLALLLRNLLKMPGEMVQLMALLASMEGVPRQELLQKLLSEEARIPLEDLQQFLTQNGEQLQSKLLKLLQHGPPGQGGSNRQMGEMLNTMAQLLAKAANSPTEALHTTLSLYLPYYPLEAPQRFSLHFEPLQGDGESGEEGGEDSQLVLFIDTLSLGVFKLTLISQRKNALLVFAEHDATARPVLPEIQQQLQAAFSMDSVPRPECIFKERLGATPAEPHAESSCATQQDEPSVAIHPGAGVSVVSIHAAYLLIRIILDLDNRNALHQSRARQT